MSSLDGQDLFASGPHAFTAGSWRRDVQRRGFAGLDGELSLDAGLRSRTIVQTGRLQDDTPAELDAQVAAVQAFADGGLHTLVDNHGVTHDGVRIESVEPQTPIRRGRGFWLDYTITYRQTP